MSPTSCRKCEAEFMRRTILQAEALHIARTVSAGAARALVDEELNDFHCEHRGAASDGEAEK